MNPGIDRHLGDDEVERYSMGTMSEEELAPFEEHLLICGACRERVEKDDQFVRGVQRAAPAARAAQVQPPRRMVQPVWLAAAACVLLASVVWVRNGAIIREPQTVRLEAMRGFGAKAAADTPLLLQPDLRGLPSYPKYRLEVVNEIGGRVFETEMQTQATVPGVPKGVYFVRVYAPSGEVLREYAVDTR